MAEIKTMSPLLLVADLEKSIRFYTDNLGFEIDFRYEDFYASVKKESFSIHLKREEQGAKDQQYASDTERPDIIFSIGDLENLFSELSQHAVRILQPIRQMPYGKEFYVADPDGHVLAFIEA